MKISCLKRSSIMCGIAGIWLMTYVGPAFGSWQSSAGYAIPVAVIAGGGGEAASANYRLQHSLAQPSTIGASSSANYRDLSGFWTHAIIRKSVMGDLNADDIVDLFDAIVALQIMSIIKSLPTVDVGAAINREGNVGAAELIFILQKTAGIR